MVPKTVDYTGATGFAPGWGGVDLALVERLQRGARSPAKQPTRHLQLKAATHALGLRDRKHCRYGAARLIGSGREPLLWICFVGLHGLFFNRLQLASVDHPSPQKAHEAVGWWKKTPPCDCPPRKLV